MTTPEPGCGSMVETMPTAGLTLAWAWLLLLLPLPWLIRKLLSAASQAGTMALKVPWFSMMTATGSGWMRKPLLAAAASLVWALLLLAAARPDRADDSRGLDVDRRHSGLG